MRNTFFGSLFLLLIMACSGSQEPEVVDVGPQEPDMIYHFPKDSFLVYQDEIRKNEVLSTILYRHHVDWPEIDKIVKACKGTFNVHGIRLGNTYTVLCAPDSTEKCEYFIYENSPAEYVVIDIEEPRTYIAQKETRLETEVAHGIIESSLFLTMTENELSPALAMEMADIYAWTIDFYRLAKGDRFKVFYEKKYVEDKFIGIGNILACEFEHKGDLLKAYRYEDDGKVSFYDEEGNSLRKAFLKSPLKFGRISSKYSKNRFHPVQKRWKAHKGTDYAAPTGTPILATGDGTVIAATYKKHNGKYVKIRHNNKYTTQYLHMSKILVKNGQNVKQGQTIGHVGSTGLATGPHVCYRFWKNGKQVDHLREKFPSAKPLNKKKIADFRLYADSLERILDHSNRVIVEKILKGDTRF
ncbi:MAG: peptidoglycan DD-metalloendopeptidase family protein [Flavobacteriales bacterium]|nr:peptidoglycan DD-metalloendopeptidase family protein [Flavobacteriales bacterium]